MAHEPTFASLLNTLQSIFPNYGDSFYAKGKLFRREQESIPSSVIIDFIRQCSFRCDFCFAAATAQHGDYDSAEKIAQLIPELRGIGKISLIGGAPLEHPEFHQVVNQLWDCATREIEVFTNGAAIPLDLAEARNWLTPALENRTDQILRFTLAVDVFHRRKLGADRFDRLTELLVSLENEGLIQAMFNVTDRRIYTADYMDFPTVRQVLEELCPLLVPRFSALMEERRIESSFYLNPVIAQGRQGEDSGVEMLRPVDFLFHLETVLTGRSGHFVTMSALNAVWMEEPPARLVVASHVGTDPVASTAMEIARRQLENHHYPWLMEAFVAMAETGEGRDRCLKEMIRRGNGEDPASIFALQRVTSLLRDGLDGEVASWLSALKIHSDFRSFLESPEASFEDLAQRLLEVVPRSAGSPATDLGGRKDFDKLRLPVVRRVLSRLIDESGGTEELFSGIAACWQTLVEGDGQIVPVLVTRTQTLGGVSNPDPIVVPLTQTSLDTGFGLWPDPGAEFVTAYRIVLRDGARGEVSFPEMELLSLPMSVPEALAEVAQLVSYWDVLLGRWAEPLRQHLWVNDSSDWSRSLNQLLMDGASQGRERIGETSLRLADVFEYVSFNPSRNRSSWDNPVLLDLLARHTAFPGWRSDDVTTFLEKVAFWKSYFGPGKRP